jgi:hypothetical protein
MGEGADEGMCVSPGRVGLEEAGAPDGCEEGSPDGCSDGWLDGSFEGWPEG